MEDGCRVDELYIRSPFTGHPWSSPVIAGHHRSVNGGLRGTSTLCKPSLTTQQTQAHGSFFVDECFPSL